jgi:rifampin ADP-ribosylating transferase
MRSTDSTAPELFYHGTRADLKVGDLITAGYRSNYGARKQTSWVYLTGTLDAAIWGAELALGEGRQRIYIVEPTGPIVDDPNLTDKKFPGNPTRSYRSREPLRITGEVREWQGHSAERLKEMKEAVERMRAQGVEAID